MIIHLISKLHGRYTSIHSDHKRIATGAVWVAIFVLVGKLASAAKEMAIAYRYGISQVMDAYQLALTLVTWLPGTLVSAISLVLIPLLVRLRHRESTDHALFLSELQGASMVFGLIFCALSIAFAEQLMTVWAGNLSSETQKVALLLTWGMTPIALLMLMIGFYATRLQAQEKHLNTLLESVPAVTILFFVMSGPRGVDYWQSLLWGTLIGFALQAVWLAITTHSVDSTRVIPRLSCHSPYWPDLYKAAGIMLTGQFIMSFVTPLDQYTATQLGNGAIATLGYANRVISLVLGLGATAITRAVLPVFSISNATADHKHTRRLALMWSTLMLTLGIMVLSIGWLLAPWGIRLLFERGAFTSHDTTLVVEVLRWGLLQTPFFFAALVLVQFLASRGRYLLLTLGAAISVLVKSILNHYLSQIHGVAGIMQATALMYFVSFGIQLCYTKKNS